MKIAEGRRMGKYTLVSSLVLFFGWITLGMHPFYLSVTDVELFPADRLAGVTIKVFTDDLESVLEQRGAERLKLGTSDEHSATDLYIARYLDQVIQWSVNEQPVTFRFLGKEVEDGVTFLYMEASDLDQVSQLEVSHRLFLDELETQENIVHLHCEEGLSSTRLNRRMNTDILRCEDSSGE